MHTYHVPSCIRNTSHTTPHTQKPVGFNQWEVMESGAAAPYLLGASLPPNMTGPELLRAVMDRAVADGMSFMRAWGHGVHNETALQTAPGVYREGIFVGLDYALDEARKHGLKVGWFVCVCVCVFWVFFGCVCVCVCDGCC